MVKKKKRTSKGVIILLFFLNYGHESVCFLLLFMECLGWTSVKGNFYSVRKEFRKVVFQPHSKFRCNLNKKDCGLFILIGHIFSKTFYLTFLLDIYFIHISVYMSIPISQFIPPPPPPLPLSPLGVHMFVLYICVSISALETVSSVPFF